MRCVYSLALLACFMNALSFITQSILALFVIFHGWRYFKSKEAWQLFYNDENNWQMTTIDTQHSIEILPSTVITRQIIFLHYQLNGIKFYRIITKDALVSDLNNYRQLIVALKTCT
jgi:hypothetical protein